MSFTITHIVDILSWLVISLLLMFMLRRLLMLLAASLPFCKSRPEYEPSVGVIASVFNEEENLPGLLKSLEELRYPKEKLRFTLVDDCSHDATPDLLRNWTSGRPNARHLVLPDNVGKSEALNYALRAMPESELIAVYDADLRPRPESLRILTCLFENKSIGAVSGFRSPGNAAATLVAAYGALESLVHQLITQAGKDRLGLNPTTMGGNCVYRRSALQKVNGFPPGALSEDIETSLSFVAAGWRTRFCVEAVADSSVVVSLRRYWNQRCRWTRGLYRSGRRASGLEGLLVSAGYSDRLVLLMAFVLAVRHHISVIWPALYCVVPIVTMAFAIWKAKLNKRLTARTLLSILPMFAVDIAVTIAATGNALLGRRQRWYTGGASR